MVYCMNCLDKALHLNSVSAFVSEPKICLVRIRSYFVAVFSLFSPLVYLFCSLALL